MYRSAAAIDEVAGTSASAHSPYRCAVSRSNDVPQVRHGLEFATMSGERPTSVSLLRFVERRWKAIGTVSAPLPDGGVSGRRGVTAWRAPLDVELERGDVLVYDDARWLLLADETPAGQRWWSVRALDALPSA
jgi:hypothetical protein